MKFEVKKMGINGEGIAYDQKKPVFIEGALDGETVDATIIKKDRNYSIAKLNRVLEASEDRVKPVCPFYKDCGGCSLLHASYEKQKQIKKDILAESLAKYADVYKDFDIEENENIYGYRNQLKMPFGTLKGKLVNGMYAPTTHIFVPIEHCMIHQKDLEEKRKEILEILNEYKYKPYDNKSKSGMRYLVLRGISGKYQMTLVTGEDDLDKEVIYKLSKLKGMVSVYQSINTVKNPVDVFGKKMLHLAGNKSLRFEVNGIKLHLSAKSFYQLNTQQAKKMYQKVIGLIPENTNTLVEAYCGIGAMSLMAAKKCKNVYGVEYIQDAVVSAESNAKNNNIENAKFMVGDCGEVLSSFFKHRKVDVLITDPPRSGMDENMIINILKSKIQTIIYVSCNPSTLAKNINDLSSRYKVVSVEAIDMFSNTAHCETIALLVRK